jgi:hypothetical protein
LEIYFDGAKTPSIMCPLADFFGDGRPRQIDYLGTEGSFTFSWGFRETFVAARAGMTLVELGDVNRLSIYRFHDHLPIRFNQSLRWHINWRNEHFFTRNPASSCEK